MTSPGLAVVTGGAGALGSRIATRLADAGHALLLVDRDPQVSQVAARLAQEAGVPARGCIADLTGADGVASVATAVEETPVPCTVVVNSAGILRDARIRNLSDDAFASVVDVNLVAAIRLTLGLRPLMAEGASVVNLSSRAGLGNFGQANYVASKSGLIGATRALANRWAPQVRVNAVAPSLIESPMTRTMRPDVLSKLVARIPAGRIGAPDDVSDAVAFLTSPAASYITGQMMIVCGGRSIAP